MRGVGRGALEDREPGCRETPGQGQSRALPSKGASTRHLWPRGPGLKRILGHHAFPFPVTRK